MRWFRLLLIPAVVGFVLVVARLSVRMPRPVDGVLFQAPASVVPRVSDVDRGHEGRPPMVGSGRGLAAGAPEARSARCLVTLNLVEPVERDLAREAKSRLEVLQPENPGRDLTFGAGRLGELGLTAEGWFLSVVDLRGRPGDWRARVEVTVRARDSAGDLVGVGAVHLEVYRCVEGRCYLETDSVSPGWDPDRGLMGAKM